MDILTGILALIMAISFFVTSRNRGLYQKICRYEIPRATGLNLYWLFVTCLTSTQLFDALNVSHMTRRRINLADDLMALPKEEREKILATMKKDKTPDKPE